MDQDDSMLSSPASPTDEAYDEENLFPEPGHHNSGAIVGGDFHARPQTPQNDHLNAAAPGELSPPRSQSNSANAGTAGDDNAGPATTAAGAGAGRSARMVSVDDSEDRSPTAANRTVMPVDGAMDRGGGIGGAVGEEWRPGGGWKSKKAQEDMQRAWDSVVDKDFSLKDYGDVMAHRLTK